MQQCQVILSSNGMHNFQYGYMIKKRVLGGVFIALVVCSFGRWTILIYLLFLGNSLLTFPGQFFQWLSCHISIALIGCFDLVWVLWFFVYYIPSKC